MRTQRPHAGHQLFIADIAKASAKHEGLGISKIEQIALMAQLIGQLACELPPNLYPTSEIMGTVAANIVSGNQQRAGESALLGIGKAN